MEHLQAFIADCDRRTEAAKKRLAETQEELTAEVAVKANAVHQLAEEIGKKLAKAEALGEAGEVEESVQLMAEIDELRAKKVQAEQEYRSSMPASSYQQQKLRVCEVCSAYLGIHDNDIRLADHFGGKLHLGFMAIRDKLAELEVSTCVFSKIKSPIKWLNRLFSSLSLVHFWIARKLPDHEKMRWSVRGAEVIVIMMTALDTVRVATMWVAGNWIDDRVCTGRVAKNDDTDRRNQAAAAVQDLAAKARAIHHHADVHIRANDDKPMEENEKSTTRNKKKMNYELQIPQ